MKTLYFGWFYLPNITMGGVWLGRPKAPERFKNRRTMQFLQELSWISSQWQHFEKMRAKSKFSALANRAIFRKKPLDFEWYSNKKTRSLNDVKISHLVSIVLCSMLMSPIGHHHLFRTYCVGLWPPVRILISFFKRFQACSFCVGIGIMHDGQKTWLFWPLIIHLVVDNFMWKLNRSINV